MQYLEKKKIGKAHQKPDMIYLLVRLPRHLINIIGETANPFKTRHEGRVVASIGT